MATDELISHAAHFLGKSKKDVVDAAVREYVDSHRNEINAGIRAALGRLDGTSKSAVALLADVPIDQLDEYGGLAEEQAGD
ncbi:hypothetical protein AB0H83_24965 [Dactylosporangium sp. NPDC050688]|uniref:hypothetical protein n=1 Tax=Dactylosporangium sp. NPDC050688 TaxID=3157217 RepID=UPI003404C431